VAEVHYDLGNDLYEAMLDPSMAYSCGYWAQARTLDAAQEAKLDLICQKLQLRPDMSLLDIGCGWGSLMLFAAQHYGVRCLGLTVSKEQARWGAQKVGSLPVRFELCDYRKFNRQGAQQFDRVASVGMFEHVGPKNYRSFFDLVHRSLRSDGLLMLHTIGKNKFGDAIDPWIERYIFPNGALPAASEIAACSEGDFVLEDWHNLGADYDKTLMQWHANINKKWKEIPGYDERFRRMWNYYLLSSAAGFRTRHIQLIQIVFRPMTSRGAYKAVR
jgi:cyclopropane-fatty-acyl-phospholipid synthase